MITINKKDENVPSITVKDALYGSFDAGSVFRYQNDGGYLLKLEHGAGLLVGDDEFDVVIDFQNEADVDLFSDDCVTHIPSGFFKIEVNV